MANPLEQFSPRVSVSYALTEKWSINANSGRYYQLPPYTSLGYKNLAGDLVNKTNNISYIAANHFIGGFEFAPKKNVQFTIEGFYKDYSNYPFSVNDSISLASKGGDFGVLGDEEIVSIATGEAFGVEFMNRIRGTKGFTATNSYTWVRSSTMSITNNDKIPTTWDSKHLFTSTLSKNFNNTWIIGAKWRFVGGLPYTPFDLETSAIKTIWDTRGGPILDYSQFNKARFKSFHQLDIRVDHRWYFDTWTFMLYIDIQNLYNFQAEQSDIIIREQDANGNFILENNGTSYKLRTIENSSGTVLPTLGIMIEF